MKGAKVELSGKEYFLLPPNKDDLDEIDKFVRQNRQSPLAIVKDNLDGLDKDQQKDLLRQALEMEASRPKGVIGQMEYAAALDSREGFALMFWLMARRNHPDLQHEDVLPLIMDATQGEFEQLLAQRDGMVEGDDGEPEQSSGSTTAD
jgi:hypothetical protein